MTRTIFDEYKRLGRVTAFLVSLAAAVLALSLLALAGGMERAEAAFPGKNGKIAFQRGTKISMKKPVLAAAETRLVDDTIPDSQASFSPDGTKVAFIRLGDIYVTKADGSGTPTKITDGCVTDSEPAWSHDGTRVVFVRRSDNENDNNPCDGQNDIWTTNADGSGTPAQLTTDGLMSAPAWSVPVTGAPDGRIVYRYSASQLWTMDPDGNNKTRLNYSCPNDNGGVCDPGVGTPTFSPDGTKVAFDYSGDIYWTWSSGIDPGGAPLPTAYPILRDRKGTETTADDTEYPGAEVNAAWSPDGTKIAFEHNGNISGSQHAIYVANADGSSTQATQVTSTGVANPDWQQDSIPPNTTVTSGPASITRATSAKFSFDSSETDSTFKCSLDGALFTACASGKGYSGLDDGLHTFRVRATDAAGNVDPTPAVRRWKVDTQRPSGTLVINGGRASTATRTVTLTLSASDPAPASGVSRMRFKNNGATAWSRWYTYTTSKSWVLSAGAGKKTVYVQYKDRAGNVSATTSDSIFYRP